MKTTNGKLKVLERKRESIDDIAKRSSTCHSHLPSSPAPALISFASAITSTVHRALTTTLRDPRNDLVDLEKKDLAFFFFIWLFIFHPAGSLFHPSLTFILMKSDQNYTASSLSQFYDFQILPTLFSFSFFSLFFLSFFLSFFFPFSFYSFFFTFSFFFLQTSHLH